MNTIYFYTLFDGKKPRCAAIKINDGETKTYDLFRPGAGKPIKVINTTLGILRDFLLTASDRGYKIITTNFKQLISTYKLPIDDRQYNVYDLHFDSVKIKSSTSQAKDFAVLRIVIDKMAQGKHYEYQKALANAAVVYQDLEQCGLILNDQMVYPEWSMMTFSGRSKSTGFNIQGYHEEHKVRTVSSNHRDILIHFDWISADIRAAGLLSNDALLNKSFETSDPYLTMMEHINAESLEGEHRLTRDECKILLLKSINAMDANANLRMFPDLMKWIDQCYRMTRKSDGMLETVLHRKFKVSRSKNDLAVLNGIMQGSIAHAMHIVLRKVWERFGSHIVTEIHDSLIMCVPPDPIAIKAMIKNIVPIMMYPFADYLPDNPSFPVKISLGKKWKNWVLKEVHRASGVEHVRPTITTTPSSEEAREAS